MANDGSVNIRTELDTKGIDEGLKRVKTLLDDAGKYYASLGKEGAEAFKKISEQMKVVDAAAAVSGDKVGALAEKKKILKAAIENLIANGLNKEDLKVKSLQKAYDELTGIQEKTRVQTGKSTKTFSDSFAKMRDVMQGPVAAAKMIFDGVKKVVAVVNDLTDAYKAQEKAETQLEQAAKNNPFLNQSSVATLKDYASELQSMSTMGDEELLPFMAQLATAGRTQDEIMKIMAVSLDIAASGSMSMDAAVRNLNKSFGGFSGELGETVPEIKALTAEELKQGKAVDVLASRYKGMAEEVAKATGTSEQMKNAWGDLKEELGAGFEKALSPMRRYFTELFANLARQKKELREEKERDIVISSGAATAATYTAEIKAENEKLLRAKQQLEDAYKAGDPLYITTILESDIKKQEAYIRTLETIMASMASREAAAQAVVDAEKKAAETAAQVAQRDKDADDYIAANTAARLQAIEVLKQEAAVRGEIVDSADILAIYQKSYVDLVTQSGGLVTVNNKAAISLLATTMEMLKVEKDRLDTLTSDAEKLKERNEYAEKYNAFMEELGAIQNELSEGDTLRKQIAELQNYYDAIVSSTLITEDQKLAIQKEFAEKKKKLEDDITKVEEAAQRERLNSYLDKLNTFAVEYANAMQSISALATEIIETQAQVDKENLAKQYADGIISASEYEKQLAAIDKDAAEKKYRLAMWEWSSQVVSAVASTAMGIAKALEMGWMGLIIGPLIAAAGAAQLATVISNKPVKPSFANGGIVPGTSYSGDRVEALVNSGEMILNTAQQKRLFDTIDRGQIGSSPNIKIYNTAANDVEAKPSVSEDGVTLMIRKIVSKDMAEGRFNGSYKAMQAKMRGTRYTN